MKIKKFILRLLKCIWVKFLKLLGLVLYSYHCEELDNLNTFWREKNEEASESYNVEIQRLKSKFKAITDANKFTFKLKLQQLKDDYGIIDPRPNAATHLPPIVPKTLLPISSKVISRFDFMMTEMGIKLNPEQRNVLYCTNPATNVIAGAGAGKSTVLALKVLLFVTELNIKLTQITVLTFTCASREDFVEKIINLFKSWNREISYKEANSVIRTFHSVAYEVHRKFNSNNFNIIFNKVTPKIDDDDEYGAGIENQNEEGLNQIKEVNETIELLDRIMSRVYKVLYTQDKEFREYITILYVAHYRINNSFEEDYAIRKASFVSKYDKSLSEYMWNGWQRLYPELIDNLNSDYICNGKEPVGETYLRYHLYLPNLNVKIFLSFFPKDKIIKDIELTGIDGSKKEASFIMWTKRKVAFNLASINYIIIESESKLRELLNQEHLRINQIGDTIPAPHFYFECIGGYVKHKESNFEPIYKQFYQMISFIYSLGRSLNEITKEELIEIFSECSVADQYFVSATKIFQKALELELSSLKLITFDQIFHEFSNPKHDALQNFNSNTLSSLDHLFIDEFQDISPNFINFINTLKAKRLVAIKNNETTKKLKLSSIVTVGDECQTIYGWRGSSDQFIYNFESYFPISSGSQELDLIKNYRSSKVILDYAKICVTKLRIKKEYEAVGEFNYSKNTLLKMYQYINVKDDKNKTQINYTLLAKTVLEEAKIINASEENKIYILYRKVSLLHDAAKCPDWRAALKMLLSKKCIKLMTIHTSKGLEAHSVFILGDMEYKYTYPVNNAVYYWANMTQTYDDSMDDESYRLGYVAITRAKNRIHWFLQQAPDKEKSVSRLYQ